MAKFKVLKKYKDKELNRVLSPGEKVEMTVKRSEEVNAKLKEHGGPFLERIQEKKLYK